ncbi:hypothetical protein SNOG_13540 [Parastagonospora nodorum SN15]|uniref:Uncharacterized protein n=1 Tax=Phaeosphaeria nodorum (strain SN15 / ATCC MYA-4574 / FGSC 10173) TaxID=321614 RepID=Q0U3X4_PHANO|nr:hypothetical protein SNOG_13540 [Parastagonospora nodorum SN15]EAT78987.1 hypothetical protein SNOG_13540 [Parastagonospora nodorum SN15]
MSRSHHRRLDITWRRSTLLDPRTRDPPTPKNSSQGLSHKLSMHGILLPRQSGLVQRRPSKLDRRNITTVTPHDLPDTFLIAFDCWNSPADIVRPSSYRQAAAAIYGMQ